MKIRTRLTIAFCIILFVPVTLIFAGYVFLMFMAPNESAALSRLQEEFSALSLDTIVSVSLILILTATIIVLWIYKGFVPKIVKLNKAAERIKEGDLNFTIKEEGTDELSELCNNFEEMRERLEISAKEKIRDEEEQKMLISNIAHDLKTPMTAIKGYSEGLLDGVADTREKQEDYLRTIIVKTSEMESLINELSIYSQIDTNRIPYDFQKINCMDYFDDCAADLKMDLDNRHMELEYKCLVNEKVLMIADPEQLGRVINNIISNSVKYKSKRNSYIKMTVKDVGDYIQVEITDNGIGIHKKDLPYIFDRTYRADSSRQSATGGSGIGLAIVKKIIEEHGGKIWVKSKVGIGTTLTFVLRKYIILEDEYGENPNY